VGEQVTILDDVVGQNADGERIAYVYLGKDIYNINGLVNAKIIGDGLGALGEFGGNNRQRMYLENLAFIARQRKAGMWAEVQREQPTRPPLPFPSMVPQPLPLPFVPYVCFVVHCRPAYAQANLLPNPSFEMVEPPPPSPEHPSPTDAPPDAWLPRTWSVGAEGGAVVTCPDDPGRPTPDSVASTSQRQPALVVSATPRSPWQTSTHGRSAPGCAARGASRCPRGT